MRTYTEINAITHTYPRSTSHPQTGPRGPRWYCSAKAGAGAQSAMLSPLLTSHLGPCLCTGAGRRQPGAELGVLATSWSMMGWGDAFPGWLSAASWRSWDSAQADIKNLANIYHLPTGGQIPSSRLSWALSYLIMWYLYEVIQCFAHSSVSKESTCNAEDLGSIPGSGRSPGEGNDNPHQYSCLENPMDRRVCQAIVHGVTRVGHDLATKPPPSLSRLNLSWHSFNVSQGAPSDLKSSEIDLRPNFCIFHVKIQSKLIPWFFFKLLEGLNWILFSFLWYLQFSILLQ